MKTILYKSAFLLFLLSPMLSTAESIDPVFGTGLDFMEGFTGKYTKEKTIKKEFQVNFDALLKVSNSYGNLNITSWNENKILIEVHIKTNGNNEEKVAKKLNELDVLFEASSSQVSAKTVFDKGSSNWSWGWGNNNNVNMQIDYIIKVPVKNSVNLNNDYGGIILDRIDGHAKINCDYGQLEIGELRGRSNQLNFDYTTKSRIGYINSGEIHADYSDFTIEKAGDLVIKADYTNSTVEQMENLQYSCDYGNLDVGTAKNIQGNGDYININLGTLHGNVDINSDYGNLKIKELAADAGNVQISTDYTGVKLGYHPEYHFNFEIKNEYGNVRGKDDFEINISNEKNTEKYYKGFYGSDNSGNNMSIDSEYGDVSFSKN
ncbi:hypothetical protein K8352_02275 [Flavobacteriaceae bacterium F89]|uniref:Adhesin domain-containing protein n=1 Tax=Cerina litoralis TaxID=2874477 RepID=A0AAE3JM95_9FLAO|nr:hypothetical protein [Cerina litoralis]MCG2459570.1 hypothetical protein [Cerina litoralis]